MAVKLPFKLDVKTLTLIVSLILNLLGGTGTIEPLMGAAPESTCPPLPTSPQSAPLPAE